MAQPLDSFTQFELLSRSDVRERDVDLLLREELYVSEAFQHFFFSLLGQKYQNAKFVRARHSVDRYEGESDLEVDLNCSGQPFRLLIEDKIDAEFQMGQAERYARAGGDYVSKAECREFLTVLIAPSTYLAGSDHGFDKTIALEEIVGWFEADLHPRSQYKSSLLKSAIQRAGTVPTKDPAITKFWTAYYELSNRIARKLGMRPPGGRSGGFLSFHPADKPRYVKLLHKLNRGRVDLQFATSAFEQFSGAVRPFAEGEMLLIKTSASSSVSIWVGEVATNEDFLTQRQTAEKGIRAAEQLWGWFQANRARIESIYLSIVKQNSLGQADLE